MKSKSFIFIGAPGAGKGTVARELSAEFRLVHISTGDLLREEVKQQTELGKHAESCLKAGRLVPDDLMVKIVGERLRRPDCDEGFILDGYPRTIVQARMLAGELAKTGRKIDCAVYFRISDEMVIKRLASRLVCRSCGEIYNKISCPPSREGVCDCCGGELYRRPDDIPETVRSRLEIFHRENDPIIRFYSEAGILLEIPDADREKSLKILRAKLTS